MIYDEKTFKRMIASSFYPETSRNQVVQKSKPKTNQNANSANNDKKKSDIKKIVIATSC